MELLSVAITKLDVLSSFEKIKVCIGYELNGKKINTFLLQWNSYLLLTSL